MPNEMWRLVMSRDKLLVKDNKKTPKPNTTNHTNSFRLSLLLRNVANLNYLNVSSDTSLIRNFI